MELGNMMFGNSRGNHPVDRGMQDEFYSYMEEMGFDGYGHHDGSDERGIFENDVFWIMPYYWGDCSCDYEDKERDWCEANTHRVDCYQSEVDRRMADWDQENHFTKIEVAAGMGGDVFGGFEQQSEDLVLNGSVVGTTTLFLPRDDAAMEIWREAHTRREAFKDTVWDELCAAHNLDRRFGCAVHCTCDYQDRWGKWRSENDHAADCPVVLPNFWHKPSGFKLEWYKYPLRDSYSNAPLTRKLMRSMFAECIASMKVKS